MNERPHLANSAACLEQILSRAMRSVVSLLAVSFLVVGQVLCRPRGGRGGGGRGGGRFGGRGGGGGGWRIR